MAQVVKKRLLGPPRLFRRVFIKLTSCSGSDYSGGLVHYCSSRQAKQMFRWDLGIDKIMDYNGDINMLVQNWCNVEQQPRVHPKYFRAVFKTGEALCSGSVSTRHIIFQPLVILVFDIQGSTGGASEHAAAHCVFPEVIYPFEDNSSFWCALPQRISVCYLPHWPLLQVQDPGLCILLAWTSALCLPCSRWSQDILLWFKQEGRMCITWTGFNSYNSPCWLSGYNTQCTPNIPHLRSYLPSHQRHQGSR